MLRNRNVIVTMTMQISMYKMLPAAVKFNGQQDHPFYKEALLAVEDYL